MAQKNFSRGTTTVRIKITTRDAAKARAKKQRRTIQEYVDSLIMRDIKNVTTRVTRGTFMDI